MGGLRKGESLEYTLDGQGKEKSRKFYKFWEGGGNRYTIPNNDVSSVLHAVIERVFYVKKGGVFQRPPMFTANRHRVDHFISGVVSSAGSLFPCTPEQFCDRYVGNKRRLYVSAVRSLLEQGLEWADSKIRMFTKAEYLKPGGVPRAIQPRSPRYNVCLGCFLSPNEHKIFDAINQYYVDNTFINPEHITIAKGMNMVQRGEAIANMWDHYDDPVCVGLDASRFDQHINETLLELEHSIYLKMFGDVEGPIGEVKLSTLLKWQRRNSCSWSEGGSRVKYRTIGCRMSGDMNTSLGNIIIMTMLWATFQRETALRFHLLNDGDDSCIICSRSTAKKIVKKVEEWFLEFGITMKVEGVFNTIEEITFCQARPVWNGSNYYLCPNPNKRCFSDIVSIKDMSGTNFNKQLGAIAACGLACNGDTPVLRSLYKKIGCGVDMFIPDKSHHLYKFRQELIDGLQPRYGEPTLAHRASFERAFNISPAEQLLLEKFYEDLPALTPKLVKDRLFCPKELSILEPTLKQHDEYEDQGERLPADFPPTEPIR